MHRDRIGPLGPEQTPIVSVPAGRWQAAESLGSYSLVCCTVGPGFEFADFELLGDRAELAGELGRALPEAVRFV